MQAFTKGQRVTGPHGAGTILNFEHIESVRLPIEYRDVYTEGDRVQVQLDNPELWLHGKGNPHYTARDLERN